MKMNKIAVMAAMALGLTAFSASAQDKPPGEKPAAPAPNREQVRAAGGRIATELKLTDEQKPKFEAVMKDAAEKRKAIRDDASLTPEQRREKSQAIGEETKTKLKGILTPEQMTKYEELLKNRPTRGAGQNQPKPGEAPPK